MNTLKKIILLVIVSFLFSYSCFAQTDEKQPQTEKENSQTAEECFERGDNFLARKLIPDAIVEFKKAIPLLKEDQDQLKAEIYASLANCYNWKGTHKAAITACNKALEINPDMANAHYDLGFAYREEGNRELAEKEFALYEKLLKQEGEYIEIPEKPITVDIEKFVKPEDTSPKTDTSTGVKTSGKMPGQTEADKIAQETLIAEVMSRGLSFYDKGMIDKAIDAFKEILEIYPENSEAYYNLGNAYSDKEMFDDAISMYKKAVENNPGFVDAYLNLSTLYLDMDLIDEAISLCKQAVNTNPDDPFLCFYLGEAYALNLHYKEAITAYNKSISINPMDPETQYRLAESYYETKQFDMALKHATQAEELGHLTDSEFMSDLKKKTGTK